MNIRILMLIVSVGLFACTSRTGGKAEPNSDTTEESKVEPREESSGLMTDAEMVYFEGGTFMMGSSTGTEQEQPVHQVEVKSFKIDKNPVTVKEFRRFIQATGYQTDADKFGDSGVFDFETSGWTLTPGANWEYPLGANISRADDSHPVTHVSWNDAVAFAAWAGKRLPTEAEWEFAARCSGKSASRFSWGDELVVDGKYKANVWQGNDPSAKQSADGFTLTSPVGYYGETPCGLTDMGGNVWNWCSDTFKPYLGSNSPDPQNAELKVIRGGSFFFDQNGENSFTATARGSNTAETALFNTGFRCAMNAE
ncbi:formylglycine-generating enzyme family protein [Mangrovibacterium sp.]|uniref:formylglycine-generating enzyme family protein n=1 Tax=Mangrovibacterium sp. TaxID=1961364 RepID=UPI003564E461